MTLLAPWMLWALPVALVPLIIYLLMRFRTLRVQWGADWVLLRALERLRKRLFLDQVLLILLRTLALVALVVAFARPAAEADDAGVGGTAVHRVLVVDCSYSMAAEDGEGSRFERVRAVLQRLVAGWSRNQRWSLYVIDRDPGWRVRDATMTSSEEVTRALDDLQPVEARAAIGRALDEVLMAVGGGPAEVYLATDAQAASWDDARGVSVPRSDALRLFWIDPGTQDDRNLALTALDPGADRVLAGHPLRVVVRVRNFGREPRREIPVELLVDGRFAARDTLSLQPGQELETELDLRFDRPGSHQLTARVDGDVLAFDDRASAGIDVLSQVRIGVLRDTGRDELFDSSYPFIELAARVLGSAGDTGLAPLEVVLVDGEVDAAGLADVDVLVVDGGRRMDVGLAATLADWVGQGGALILAPGDQIDATAWNRDLGAYDLLPARLGPLQVVPLGAEGAAVPRRGSADPALRNFATTEDGDLGQLRFHTWFTLADPVPDSSEVLAFTDGSPFILTRRHGPGSVTLLATGLDGRNANLVAREVFHPFLVRLVSTAVARARDPLHAAPGEPLRLRLPPVDDLHAATFELGGRTLPVDVGEQADGLVLEVAAGADRSGAGSFLLLRESGSQRHHVGIQGARVDSDLSALEDGERAALVERLSLTVVGGWDELAEELRAGRHGAERYAWVLMAMLAFLLGELVVSRRFA